MQPANATQHKQSTWLPLAQRGHGVPTYAFTCGSTCEPSCALLPSGTRGQGHFEWAAGGKYRNVGHVLGDGAADAARETIAGGGVQLPVSSMVIHPAHGLSVISIISVYQ